MRRTGPVRKPASPVNLPEGKHPSDRHGERGSALVVAVLVSVVMVLLGIAFLLMGETENRIAQNEKRSAQAMYVAEAGARAVKRWFDDPAGAVRFPSPSVVDRTQRRIIDESDPENPAKVTPANGVLGSFPYYKQAVDLDSDGKDDLFDRPFRGGRLHSLLGTADGPDLRIDEADSTARAYLDDLTRSLVADFPGEGGGVYTRISRIDVYAPPYVEVGATWTRYGLATIRVVARLYGPSPGGEQVIAEREIEMMLGEVPYQGPYGPLHSCADLTFTQQADLGVHWGPMTAVSGMQISLGPGPGFLPDPVGLGLPREEPALPGVDPLWNLISPAAFVAFRNAIDGTAIEDPWIRLMSGERIVGAPSGVRPWPPSPAPAPGSGPTYCCDHSGIAQNVPLVACPGYDYDVWKLIATSGESDVRYFVWSGGQNFRENGTGPSRSFQQITDGEEGIYFFETRDRLAPFDVDGDGSHENLTPPVTVNQAGWHFRGVIYLNSDRFQLDSVPSVTALIRAPGEPFHDADQDGRYDAGEVFVNLAYPGTPGGACVADVTDNLGGGVIRNPRGPAINATLSFEGILFNSGSFEATGGGVIFGSVVAWEGVDQAVADGSAPTPELYWDASIADQFPPPGWKLPRAVVTGWRSRH